MAKNLVYYQSKDETVDFHHSIGLLEGDEKFNSKLHKHNCYEIIYVINGKISHYIEGEKYILTPGMLVIINYSELHMLTDVKEDYERMVLHISRDLIMPFKTEDYDLFESFKLREQGHRNIIGDADTKKYKFSYYFKKILNIISEGAPEQDLLIKCIIIEMLICVNKVYLAGRMIDAEQSNNPVKEVFKFINNNLTDNLSLDKICKHLYVTKTYLCHIFKKRTGVSIIQYINNKRVMLADEMISNGMPSTKACVESGFKNYSNFYKSYTKIMGHSPTGKTNNSIVVNNNSKEVIGHD